MLLNLLFETFFVALNKFLSWLTNSDVMPLLKVWKENKKKLALFAKKT